MGKADAYSWLQSRSGSVNAFDPDHMDADHYVEGTTGTGASNKYLTAASVPCRRTTSIRSRSIRMMMPIGNVGTGNYAFPANGITTSKIQKVANWSLSVAIKTTNTEAVPLGIIFSDGTSVTLNTDGTIAGVNDFTKPNIARTLHWTVLQQHRSVLR